VRAFFISLSSQYLKKLFSHHTKGSLFVCLFVCYDDAQWLFHAGREKKSTSVKDKNEGFFFHD